MEACSGELLPGLREREDMPEQAVSVFVSLDGVMMRMNAEATNAGWREASCGVVAPAGAGGEILESRCLGCLPERARTSLKSQPRPRRCTC